jgi:predicted nuclease of predicted toxin-antitoxin system
MKLLVDMNLSPLWVPFLSGHGVEAVHWSSVGSPSAPDSEILDFADGCRIYLAVAEYIMFVTLRAGSRKEESS